MSLDFLAQEEGVEEVKATDNLGTTVLESNVYPFVIKMAYLDESKPNPTTGNKGGAHNINLIFMNTQTKKEFRHQEYLTSGIAKGQKYYYMSKDNKKIPLPGYQNADELCQLLTGKGIGAQDFEVKAVKIWDNVQKKEVPEQRKVLIDLIGQDVVAGVVKVKENHHKNDSEIVEKNEVDKWFEGDTHLTLPEKEAGKTEAKFIQSWKAKWDGKVRDKSKKVEAKAGAPAGTETKSLFN